MEKLLLTKLRQILLLLSIVTVGVDGVHDEGGLDRHRRSVTRIDSVEKKKWESETNRMDTKSTLICLNSPLNLASSQTIGNGWNASAAIVLDGGTEQTQFTQLVHDISVKDCIANENPPLSTIRGKNLTVECKTRSILYLRDDMPPRHEAEAFLDNIRVQYLYVHVLNQWFNQ